MMAYFKILGDRLDAALPGTEGGRARLTPFALPGGL